MAYYIAYLDNYPHELEITKFANKDQVIRYLLAGHNSELYTDLHDTITSLKYEASKLLGISLADLKKVPVCMCQW